MYKRQGLNIAMVLVLVSEKVFYIQYQKGRYYCRRIFRKEEIFELDERISYKADDEFLTPVSYTHLDVYKRQDQVHRGLYCRYESIRSGLFKE